MVHTENIIKSFLFRLIFSIISLSIVFSIIIYFYQQYNFYSSITKNIEYYVNEEFKKNRIDLKMFNNNSVKDDIKTVMQKLNFIYIDIFNAKKESVHSFVSQNESYDLIKKNILLFKNDFSNVKNKMGYKFIKVNDKNYFIQIYYPIIKDNQTLGFIEGVTRVDLNLVSHYERIKYATVLIVVLTILLFSIIIFPIIYFAYKQLNKNRIELLKSNLQILNALGNAVALRDSDTNEHNYRVAIYSVRLAEKLNIDKEEIKKLIKGAFLHDIGKIGISDSILLKSNALSKEEFEIMKSHVTKGVAIINENSWLKDCQDIILCHHERYDGSGYPKGLKQSQIPLIARIFSVVDVFDALTSKRPYKEPFSYEKSIEILKEYSSVYFEPRILNAFLQIAKDLYKSVEIKQSNELKNNLEEIVRKYFIR